MILSVDPEAISGIVREVADSEILPRYQSLTADEISEKNGGELVTIADEESERVLAERLTTYLPGSVVLGEESYAKNPAIMASLEGDAPVWIIDPIDGTKNIAHGRQPFTVILALCLAGETVMGWIYEPVERWMGVAEKGAGAKFNGSSAKVAAPNSANS